MSGGRQYSPASDSLMVQWRFTMGEEYAAVMRKPRVTGIFRR